ncbi:MAG: hypothetical protein IPI61_09735 [Syntrophaceae bacterium]|nr:hypothetical protein [Syntrophaceae bacterium]
MMAVQGLLQAELPDEIAALVPGGLVALELVAAHLADVADDVGHALPVVVFPDGHDVDAHARQLQGVGLDEGELLAADVAVDPQRREGPAVLADRLVIHGKRQARFRVEGLELFHEPPEVLDVLGENDHIERRPVLDKDDTSCVDDDPPHGLHLADADPVVLGALEQVLTPDDLEVPEPQHQQADGRQDHPEEEGEPVAEFARIVPDEPIVLLRHGCRPPGG